MKRYEIRDTEHPEWRGQRFADFDRAYREWKRSFPPGRFVLVDRALGTELTEPWPSNTPGNS